MQLVPRKVLFDIMAHRHNVVLSESDQRSFDTFMKEANLQYRTSAQDINSFYKRMNKFMKKNKKSIRYVGEGSSRIVYAMADGTALKLAKTEAGIAQNKNEAKYCLNPKVKYPIFPDFYAADKKNWLALSCELCTPALISDFVKLFSTTPSIIADLVDTMFSQGFDGLSTAFVNYLVDNDEISSANLARKLLGEKGPAFDALRSLFKFYIDNGEDAMTSGDLDGIRNWGLTVRNGKYVLVVIDAGLSQDVYDKYYNRD